MRKVNGVIDLRTVKPETMEKFEYVEKLREKDPEQTYRYHCLRAGISLQYYREIRKSLRAKASSTFRTDEPLSEALHIGLGQTRFDFAGGKLDHLPVDGSDGCRRTRTRAKL